MSSSRSVSSKVTITRTRAVIFLQARVSSTRFPGKILKKIYGKPLLGYLLDRLLTTGLPVWVLVPRTEYKAFDDLHRGYPSVSFFGGSKRDVLKRFYDAASVCPADNYIRVTGDNPFTSITCLRGLLKKHVENEADISYYQKLPYGAGVEIISRRILLRAHRYAHSSYDREHVTPWIHGRSKLPTIKLYTGLPPRLYHRPDYRVTVDTPQDLRLFSQRVKQLRERNLDFSLKNLLGLGVGGV